MVSEKEKKALLKALDDPDSLRMMDDMGLINGEFRSKYAEAGLGPELHTALIDAGINTAGEAHTAVDGDFLEETTDLDAQNQKVPEEYSMAMGELLTIVKSGDVEKFKELVASPRFEWAKKNDKDAGQEVMAAVRIAIQNRDGPMLKAMVDVFNVDNPNDPRTVLLAAGQPFEIFKYIAQHASAMNQNWSDYGNPLVAGFSGGHIDTAKWLKEWADENGVPIRVKAIAQLEAAKKGHVDVVKLYTVSNPHLANVIDMLIGHGHSGLVKHFVSDKNDKGEFIHDFSHNNYRMLRSCCGHYDALSAMVRHPSIHRKIHLMPRYYRTVHCAAEMDWKKEKQDVDKKYKEMIKNTAEELHEGGMSVKGAAEKAFNQHKDEWMRELEQQKLDSFEYK